jgi:hypothetical protein
MSDQDNSSGGGGIFDDDVRARTVRNALTLIEAWCSDFSDYEELAPLVRAIRYFIDNQVDEETGLPIPSGDILDSSTYEISDEDISSALSEINEEHDLAEGGEPDDEPMEFPERKKPRTEVFEEDEDGVIQLFKKPKRTASEETAEDIEVFVEVDENKDEE